MNVRTVCGLAILGAIFLAPFASAQSDPPDSSPILAALLPEPKRTDSNLISPLRPAEADPLQSRLKVPVRFSKARFVLLSASVYGAALADMHQTMEVRNLPWWYETDPLARPFAHLPAPAYYAAGLAMATGINWLSWKMARSRRWHKLSPLPQLLSISGNVYGLHTNLH
jgi:hypothetical protein